MGSFTIRIFVLIAAVFLSASVFSSSMVSGLYEAEGGWGSLSIDALPNKPQRFTIETIGPNGHSCGISGKIISGKGLAEDTGSDKVCSIQFSVRGSAISVQADDYPSCHGYCGARASIEHTFHRLPVSCRIKERSSRRASFLKAYRAKRYEDAAATLESLQRECGRFYHWMEADQLRNDLALTLYHLDKPAECIDILKATVAAAYSTEAAMKNELAFTDFEAYLRTAKSTWYNLRLCREKLMRQQSNE